FYRYRHSRRAGQDPPPPRNGYGRQPAERLSALALSDTSPSVPLAMRLAARPPVPAADPYRTPHGAAASHGAGGHGVSPAHPRDDRYERVRSARRMAPQHRGSEARHNRHRIAAFRRGASPAR